jgi:hypothetical protein
MSLPILALPHWRVRCGWPRLHHDAFSFRVDRDPRGDLCAEHGVRAVRTRLQTPDVEDAGRESQHEQHYLERDVGIAALVALWGLYRHKLELESQRIATAD